MTAQPTETAAPVLSSVIARDLSLLYRSENPETRSIAVDGATFAIATGEILAVVGETGSGKSTLAKAVALTAGTGVPGAPIISGGGLSVLGTEVRTISARRRDRLGLFVGYVPQEAGDRLEPRWTIEENVAGPIFARDRRFDPDEAGQAVATMIDAVRLPLSMLPKFPHELSKGQRQRVAIARALVLEPRLLVADDPTAGIDATVRSAILDNILALQRSRGFSALIVTADLAEVRRVSNRVAVMHRGVFVGIGEVDAVIANPRHPYVVDLARTLERTALPARAPVRRSPALPRAAGSRARKTAVVTTATPPGEDTM